MASCRCLALWERPHRLIHHLNSFPYCCLENQPPQVCVCVCVGGEEVLIGIWQMCHRVLMSCSGRFRRHSQMNTLFVATQRFYKNQTRNNNQEILCHFGSQKCVFGEFFVVKVSKTEDICDTEVWQANFILANSFSKTTTTKKSHKGEKKDCYGMERQVIDGKDGNWSVAYALFIYFQGQ